ncbi:MAG: ferric reductase-like transmembrane domain-containing protein [Candidatus Sericytochromatia bacterium]|nr:ferric reductase-like transmembrane domain-containing protein [Candidatus Sericytochromatia bacterium]
MQSLHNADYISWKHNRLWFLLTLALTSLILILDKIDIYNAAQGSSTFGIIFLVLSLLPNNFLKLKINKLQRFQKLFKTLARYRRDFGITAGILFIIHTITSLGLFGTISFEFIFSQPIILGLISLVIMIALLLTSSKWTIKKLGKKWKPLHSLIWILIPLALTHSLLSSNEYAEDLSKPALIGFGSALALVIFELYRHTKRTEKKEKYTLHIQLVTLGTVISLFIIFLYPNNYPG